VARLGVGAHVRFSRLDEGTLEHGLRRVLEPGVRERAAALGARLRAEPAAAPVAADLVESAARHPVG
jgi:UDP:flavonoid glycosyltransferase YjiC (YdhE family)